RRVLCRSRNSRGKRITPASFSRDAMAATPLPFSTVTVTVWPAAAPPVISRRNKKAVAPAASSKTSSRPSRARPSQRPFLRGAVCLLVLGSFIGFPRPFVVLLRQHQPHIALAQIERRGQEADHPVFLPGALAVEQGLVCPHRHHGLFHHHFLLAGG